ncbi:MAG: primosomal protein N' [Bacteroidota bacterium]
MDFVDLLLPGKLHQSFTYELPSKYADQNLIGHRAVAPLGKRIAIGIIINQHNETPTHKVRDILDIPDHFPLWSQQHIQFLKWIAKYYLSTLSEVIKASLIGIKEICQPTIAIHPTYQANCKLFSAYQKLINKLQYTKSLTYKEACLYIASNQDPIAVCTALLHQQVIQIAKPLTAYIPKVKYLSLHKKYQQADAIDALRQTLSKYPKQQAVLATYLKKIPYLTWEKPSWIAQKTLLKAAISPSSLRRLCSKEILVEKHAMQIIEDLPTPLPNSPTELTQTLKAIQAQWQSKSVVLLQPHTPSTLSQLLIQLTHQTLPKGQILYLLPTVKQASLAFTPLKKQFGDLISPYHGHYSTSKKIATWYGVQQGKIKCIVGTRSAMFLPFASLKYIVVADEESELYKQHLAQPYYHARDAAIVLAHHYGAHVLLSSPTPSLVSYYHAKNKKYGWVVETPPKDNAPAKKTYITSTKFPFKTPQSPGFNVLTTGLVKRLKSLLTQNKQAILLHSRKGYAAYTLCRDCRWIATCSRCQRNLIYHDTTQQLHCHHCLHTTSLPSTCEKCGSNALKYHSMGTQQVEDHVKFYIPNARLKRLDGDSASTHTHYLDIAKEFEAKKIDILITTQSIIPLLPFGTPCLIALLDIEKWLKKPSFYAYEKTYQHLFKLSKPQVATDLILQMHGTPTAELQNLMRAIAQKDPTTIYEQALLERKAYSYPPYVRMLKISMLHKDPKVLLQATKEFSQYITPLLDLPVIGPTEVRPFYPKKYNTTIFLKLPKNQLPQIKEKIVAQTKSLLAYPTYAGLKIYFDVDPL